ncbi:hypothetical protein PS15p_204680 [Mucor circinelloides]
MSAPPDESSSNSRQRVSRACDLCRRKKVKCDGATPVCTNCKAIGLECTFKDMTKKRGPPKGYIEAIENRLYKLENFLAGLAKGGDVQSKQLLSELNSPLETPSGEQIRARPVRRAPRSERNKVFFWQQDKAGKRKRDSLVEQQQGKLNHTIDDHDDDDDDDMDNDQSHQQQSQHKREESVDEGLGQLAMDENGQVRYLGKSSGYYLLQNSRTYQNGAFHFANYGNRPRNRKRNRSDNVDPLELPPKDLSEHLIRLYFKHFYPFLPLFYKRQLFSTMDHPAMEPVAPLLLNAIYAVASRISPDMRVRSDPASPDTAGDIFFERAEKLLDESYDTPSISTVQALVLLASHQHGAMKSARAWLYSGMAFRMAQDLGLHRNCDHWNIPPEECERRKRVFWCCYVVDRLASAMYGRASTFEERDCDVPFPTVDDDDLIREDDPNSSIKQPSFRLLEGFTNLIKICDILGHVLKNIYYVRSLQYTGAKQADSVLTTWNKKLQQWYDHLPDSLQIKKDSSNSNHTLPPTAVCQLHMIYHTTVILLHRPFIPGPNQSLLPSLLPCASICSAAADAVLSITNAMLAENKLRYVMNYAVYYIFTSGIIFIRTACTVKPNNAPSLSSDDKSLEAKVKVTKCMQALDEIEATWTTASKSCQILAELSGFRDPDFQDGSYQQQQQHGVNQWQHQNVSLIRQQEQHQQPHGDSRNTPTHLQPISPQSSNSSPQIQYEQHQRTNSSNLRFPIIRADQKNDNLDARPLYTSSPSSSSSALNMDFATPNPFQVQNNGPVNNATAMDPFAAPGIIPIPSPRQYDPLGNAFWGVPSSLDVNEWNNFMSSNLGGQQQQHDPFASADTTCLQDRQVYETQTSAAPSITTPSNSLNNYQPTTAVQKQRLIHTDQHVDVLSGVSMPLDQSTSNSANTTTLMSYLPHLQNEDSQNTANNSSNNHDSDHTLNNPDKPPLPPPTSIPMDSRPPTCTGADLANAYYW